MVGRAMVRSWKDGCNVVTKYRSFATCMTYNYTRASRDSLIFGVHGDNVCRSGSPLHAVKAEFSFAKVNCFPATSYSGGFLSVACCGNDVSSCRPVMNERAVSIGFYVHRRSLHTSSVLWEKEDSGTKAERTLKLLREQINKEVDAGQSTAVVAPKKTIWQRVVDECKHYYHGAKLLVLDIRVACRLLWHARNNTLTRKERRQLLRTTADLFRLVPFAVIVVVPFMEFTLPFLIKLFPNFLPSTFQEASKEKEKLRKQLKVKLEMAKFLQDTLEELSLESKKKEGAGTMAADFAAFMKKMRSQGEMASNEELLKFSKLFEDELTLDNLSMSQLRALCRIVGIQPLGTPNILRFQLTLKLRELRADDRMIKKEGVESLTVEELQTACRARGMRAAGLSEERLRKQLSQWLELSLNEKIPPSLLLLSRTLYISEDVSFTDRLNMILSTLPQAVAEETKLKLSELEGGKIDNKAKLEILKSIEEGMKREREEEKRLAQAAKEKKLKEEQDALAQVATAAETLVDKGHVLEQMPLPAAPSSTAKEKRDVVAPEELREVEKLLGNIADGEKRDLKELKDDVQEYKDDVETVTALTVLQGKAIGESKAAKRLASRVDQMIKRMEKVSDRLQNEREALQASSAEHEAEKTQQASAEAKKEKERLININELLVNLKHLQRMPGDVKDQRIVDVLRALDEDRDGAINLDLALEVIELLGSENVKMSQDQIQKLLEMLRKEDKLDAEENREHGILGKPAVVELESKTMGAAATNMQSAADTAPKDIAKELRDEEPQRRKAV